MKTHRAYVINIRRLLLLLLITGAYWYRLFQAGGGIVGKSRLFQIICVLGFLLLHAVEYCRRNETRLLSTPNMVRTTVVSHLIIIVYGALSVTWAMFPREVLLAVIEYAFMMLVMVEIPILTYDRRDIMFCAKVCLVNTAASCLLAFYEMFTGSYVFALTSSAGVLNWKYAGMHAPIVQYNHPNNLSTALLLSLPICAIALKEGRKPHKLAYGALTAAILLVFVAANARFSILVLLMFLCLSMLKNQKGAQKLLIFFMVLLCVAFAGTLVLESMDISMDYLTDNARLRIWANAFRNFLDSNGLGVGLGNAADVNRATASASYIGRPCHNYGLETLEESGVVGFAAWIVWLITLIRGSSRMSKKWNNSFTWGAFCVLLMFVPMTIQQSSLLGSMTVWMFFGIAMAINEFAKKELEAGGAEPAQEKTSPSGKVTVS